MTGHADPLENETWATSDGAVAAPGSLGLKERRSWPTWVVVVAALVAGAVGGLIGDTSNGATSTGVRGPSFPSGPATGPSTSAGNSTTPGSPATTSTPVTAR